MMTACETRWGQHAPRSGRKAGDDERRSTSATLALTGILSRP